MNLLLDTHALLFWLFDSPRLSKRARVLIADPENQVYVSSASTWEVSLKHRLGKLSGVEAYVAGPAAVHAEAGFRELAISVAHARLAGALAIALRDPFDRMLIAQSELEGYTLVTRDESIRAHYKKCRW